MLMVMAVFTPPSSRLAKKKKPDQLADRHQGKGADHDEKIRPGRRHPAHSWQCVIHDVKIKSGSKNCRLKVTGFHPGCCRRSPYSAVASGNGANAGLA